jgi:hypothetical protein
MSKIPVLTTARTFRILCSMLDRAGSEIVLGPMRKNAATVDFTPEFCPNKIVIRGDGNQTPLERNILHELIHVLVAPWILAFDEQMEEVAILAWESHLWDFVTRDKRRSARWQALVAKKVAEYEATLPETPIAELIDR